MACKIVENGAIGPVVAMAAIDQRLERIFQRLQLGNLGIDFTKLLLGHRLHIAARPVAIGIERQQQPAFIDGKAEIAGAMEKAKAMHIV